MRSRRIRFREVKLQICEYEQKLFGGIKKTFEFYSHQ